MKLNQNKIHSEIKVQCDNLNMSYLSKLPSITIPTLFGIGVVWIGTRLIKNEQRLKERMLELKLQHGRNSLKGI
ncbi:hypothetical protein [Prochlorococcus marinus]|uniref:hypothetical protein n=1 Tax=Prochlorococcus marinus TaxID=1219 RepID=UPI0022B37A79|nr:hypothetical protein [Prochlorococcus marinus]